jgi:hypothetical protein
VLVLVLVLLSTHIRRQDEGALPYYERLSLSLSLTAVGLASSASGETLFAFQASFSFVPS